MAKEEATEEFDEVYDGEGREDLMDNDEISPEEEAFMQGYDEAGEDEDDKEKKKDDEDEDDESS
ncbi:MAG: hypothetical protein ABIE94_02205 [archaeon]